MASAEYLLNEAQYAFQSISFGESRDNSRNTSRARSLCKKIMRKYPSSMEADQAYDILRRLEQEAHSPAMKLSHQHGQQSGHHQQHANAPARQSSPGEDDELEALNWSGLFTLLGSMPKIVLAVFVFAGLLAYGIFGPFLFVPLVALVFLTGPFRQLLKPHQRKAWNEFVVRTNAFIEDRQNA